MAITIREANLKDVPQIVELWIKFMGEHDEIVIHGNPEFKEHVAKDTSVGESYRIFLQSHIESTEGVVFMAMKESAIIGYILIFIKDEIPIYKNKRLGYIGDLYIKKDFRSQGLSSKLKDKSLEWFKKKEVKFIAVPVSPSNKQAYSVYKKWGFLDYTIEMRREI